MAELTKKDQLYELIRANPFISQQDLAGQLGLSRSAVAGYIAGLIRDRRLLGATVLLQLYFLVNHIPNFTVLAHITR